MCRQLVNERDETMKSIPLLCFVLVAMILTVTPVTAQDPTIPEAYRAIYVDLENELDMFNAQYADELENPSANTYFGAELLVADGNRGEALLTEPNMRATIQYMEALQRLGANGVSIQISYPLLLADYPRQGDYLAYYQAVVSAAHERGLLVLVESSPVFPDEQYSNVKIDFSDLTLDTYFATRIQMLVTIARDIQPDFLSIGHEPNTEKVLTGLEFTPEQYLRFLDDALEAIGAPLDMKIGIGSSMWDAPLYVNGYLERSGVDFINFHLYSLGNGERNFLEELLVWGAYVRGRGKEVIIGETWLYKLSPEDFVSDASNYQEIYGRDMFDFWQPLDARHIETVSAIARARDFTYVSFFWSTYLFGYVRYEDAVNLSYVQRYQAVNLVAYENLLNGTLSLTGETFQRVLSQ